MNLLLNFTGVPPIIGQLFQLYNAELRVDLLYHVHRMEMSLDGYKFLVQFKGSRYDTYDNGVDLRILICISGIVTIYVLMSSRKCCCQADMCWRTRTRLESDVVGCFELCL